MAKKDKLSEELVSNPEEVQENLDFMPGLQIDLDFQAQIYEPTRNGWKQMVIYESFLMFATHLPSNYLGVNKSFKEYKDKILFCLPKKAFKEYINKIYKSYTNGKIFEILLLLGKKKVVTLPGVIVELFEMVRIEDLDDFWCILIHQTTVPYICAFVTPVLAIEGLIPFVPQNSLSRKQMREEREKAGLYVSPMLKYDVGELLQDDDNK
jgi:hypothetical protein